MKTTVVHALFAGAYAFTPCNAFAPRVGLPSLSSKVRVALPGFSSVLKRESLPLRRKKQGDTRCISYFGLLYWNLSLSLPLVERAAHQHGSIPSAWRIVLL